MTGITPFMQELLANAAAAAAVSSSSAVPADIIDANHIRSDGNTAAIKSLDPTKYVDGIASPYHAQRGVVVPSARRFRADRSQAARDKRVVRVVQYDSARKAHVSEVTVGQMRAGSYTVPPIGDPATPDTKYPVVDVAADVVSPQAAAPSPVVEPPAPVPSPPAGPQPSGSAMYGIGAAMPQGAPVAAGRGDELPSIPARLTHNRVRTQLTLHDIVPIREPSGVVVALVTVGDIAEHFDVSGTPDELRALRVELADLRPGVEATYVVSLSGLSYPVRGREHRLWHVHESR